jgi:hypothetical protein
MNTAAEINMDNCIVKRMNKNEAFEPITSVNARDSSSLNFYTYMNTQLQQGINTHYYRLKMIDQEHTENYSKVVAVVLKENLQAHINVFPNRGKELINVQFDNPNDMITQIEIINVFNQTMMTTEVNESGNITKTFDLSRLPKGIYFIQIKSTSQIQTIKIELQ